MMRKTIKMSRFFGPPRRSWSSSLKRDGFHPQGFPEVFKAIYRAVDETVRLSAAAEAAGEDAGEA
jgi:hypothetical protein